MGLPPEILPVVSIVALGFIVFFVEWTPFSLKVEHIEISILLQEMDDPCLDIFHRVSKGAILSILALMDVFGELCAELCLVLLHMVKPLYSVMGQVATVFLLALISF